MESALSVLGVSKRGGKGTYLLVGEHSLRLNKRYWAVWCFVYFFYYSILFPFFFFRALGNLRGDV